MGEAMKKRIIIIGTVTLCLILMFVIVFVVRKDKRGTTTNDVSDEVAIGIKIINISSMEEYKELANTVEYTCVLGQDEAGASIYGFELFHESANITYYFDSDGNVEEAGIYFLFNEDDEIGSEPKEITPQELKYKTEGVLTEFCRLFEVYSLPDLYMSHNDGTFEKVESADSYQVIIDGGGSLDFSVRDATGSYWILRVYCEEKLCVVDIQRYFNVEEYKDYFANISLYKEK